MSISPSVISSCPHLPWTLFVACSYFTRILFVFIRTMYEQCTNKLRTNSEEGTGRIDHYKDVFSIDDQLIYSSLYFCYKLVFSLLNQDIIFDSRSFAIASYALSSTTLTVSRGSLS